jgi:hypothetical protein
VIQDSSGSSFASTVLEQIPKHIKDQVRKEPIKEIPRLLDERSETAERMFLRVATASAPCPEGLDGLVDIVERHKDLLAKNPGLLREWMTDLVGYIKNIIQRASETFRDTLFELRESISGLEAIQDSLDPTDKTGLSAIFRHLDEDLARRELAIGVQPES